MSTRLHVPGLIEVEGEADVVLRVYDDLKEVILGRLARERPPTDTASPTDVEESAAGEPIILDKKRRAVAKRSGPSCASRILELKSADFFKDLRDTKPVGDALSTRGHNYEGKHIAAALIDLTKRGTIRRLKRDGNWVYQNP